VYTIWRISYSCTICDKVTCGRSVVFSRHSRFRDPNSINNHLGVSGLMQFVLYKNRVRVMVFNATFNNISVISWRLVLLVEEIGSAWRKPPTCRKSLYHILYKNKKSAKLYTLNANACWFFLILQALPISSTNKTNRHDITEILLKVAINTITLTLFLYNTNCIRPLTPKWLLIELGSLFTRSMSAILQQFLYISVWGLKEVFFIISTYIYIYIYILDNFVVLGDYNDAEN
jgi:hypothetical protein